MATLAEIEREVTDAISVLTSQSMIAVTNLRDRFPEAFTPRERALLDGVAEGRETMIEDLQRLRDRLNAVIARSDERRARDEAWRLS